MPKWRLKGFSVLLGIVLGTLLIEALARVGFPHWAPRTASIASFWRHDPLLGWSHIPNAVGPFNSYGFESIVRINSKGFRDTERTYEPDPSKYRIVVLGDSMVWGWGVQHEETFAALLEKRCPGIEALNFGVSGYGTDQELLLLRHEVAEYHPQLVVVVVGENDFGTNIRRSVFLGYEKPLFQFDDQGRLVLMNTPVPRPSIWIRFASVMIRHSYVLNQAARVSEQIKLWPDSPKMSGQAAAAEHFPANVKEAITAALLLEMQEEVQKVGGELLFVLMERMDKLGFRLEEFFRSKQIHTLRLDAAFPGDPPKELYLPDGVHWTVRGNQMVADQLLQYLRHKGPIGPQSGILPSATARPAC